MMPLTYSIQVCYKYSVLNISVLNKYVGTKYMADFERDDPNKNIGYWLFYAQRCVAYAFSERMRTYCVEHNKPYVVTPPQWGVLALLYDTDGLTIGMISQQRGVDAPTVTGIVKRLEQVRLVERCHDREDRRVVKVYLTDEGKSITQSLYPLIRSFGDDTLRDFSHREQAQFLSMLHRIVANLSDTNLGTGDRFKLLPEYAVRQDFVNELFHNGSSFTSESNANETGEHR